MDEYISKNAFKTKYLCCGWLSEMSEEEFDKFPVADVRPMMRSTWKQKVVRHPFVHVLYECESCKYIRDSVSNFCPNCGADMRGKDEL